MARSKVANWVDWGPDFYAAQAYNGLSSDGRSIRGAMSIPRELYLMTIGGKASLVQYPREDWKSIVNHKRLVDQSWSSVKEGTTPKRLGSLGKAVQIELSFSDRKPAAEASGSPSQFGITVRATQDLKQQTRVGYDFATKALFIDRTQSGDVSFDSTFPSTYYAPLAADAKGHINLRVYVDWSSVEVFGGQGETTMTTQIFPSDPATYVEIFSTGGNTQDVQVRINSISSTWDI